MTHEDDDQIEETYNVNASYIKQNTDWNRKKQLALPIKTKQGQLLKNVQENGHYGDEKMNDESSESSKTDSNQVAETRTVEMVEEPKSVLDLMREKKESFDRNKHKIAHLSRLVIENPEEQVNIFLTNISNWYKFLHFFLFKDEKTARITFDVDIAGNSSISNVEKNPNRFIVRSVQRHMSQLQNSPMVR